MNQSYSLRVAAAALAAAALALAPAAAPAKAPTAPAVSHTAKQTPPIQLGTSGGWADDLANGYCCGGTLGALVSVNGQKYVLSNWHVLAMDTVPGGNDKVAATGNPVIQPGLIDVGCLKSAGQVVAHLELTPSLAEDGVNVDAAIATVVTGMVSPDGAILEIGPPAATTAAAFVGQPVKKSGRTSRLTRSKVSGLNATVSVEYDTECAGSTAFTKTFTGQVLVSNKGGRFLKAGDSGSLLVEDAATLPRAVGLLFAGSSLTAVANPIDEVLTALGAVMVGGEQTVAPAAAPPAGLEAAVARAVAAQERHAARLGKVPGSNGHAVGLDALGRVVIKVLVEADTAPARAAAPRLLDGVPVVVEAVGRIVAY